MKLNSKQLRAVDPRVAATTRDTLQRNPLYFILDNVYDTYNIGGLFRLADALSASKMYLCGETTSPPNNRIHKASCGTYKVVPWAYYPTTSDAIAECKTHARSQHVSVLAIEQSPTSKPYTSINPTFPLALVVGNETVGVSPETLSLCDATLEIPMWGINKSLNVIVSAGIVSYHFMANLS